MTAEPKTELQLPPNSEWCDERGRTYIMSAGRILIRLPSGHKRIEYSRLIYYATGAALWGIEVERINGLLATDHSDNINQRCIWHDEWSLACNNRDAWNAAVKGAVG